MDVYSTQEEQRFVWDNEKAAANFIKHGITFEDAVFVLEDPFAIFEDASVPEERRDAVIGRESGRLLLYVVHLLREDECLRLISARKATRQERRRYEKSA